MAYGAVHVARADHLARLEPLIEPLQHGFGQGAGRLRPLEQDDVAMRNRLDAQPFLEQGQVQVELAEKSGKEAVVVELQLHALALGGAGAGARRAAYRRARLARLDAALLRIARRFTSVGFAGVGFAGVRLTSV